MTSKHLIIASLDGGGPRSFSQLEIMRAIMHRLKWEKYPNEADKIMLPCEHFDLIGGSGTGGLIAIMLVRLRMSAEEASDEFFTIVEEVYKPNHLTPSERTQKLRECMEAIFSRKLLPLDLKLMHGNQTGRCQSFVVASPRINAATKIYLRTYPVPTQLPSNITVIEAALATCAAQPIFSPVSSGSGYRRKEYIGAGLGANNPVRELITEAHSLFGGSSTAACLLSLGTGHPGAISISSEGGDINLHRLREMMNDCEQRAREMEQQIGRSGIYSRFSVEQGMQNEYPGQAVDPSWILAQTESYLADHVTSEKIGGLVEKINSPITFATLDQLKYGGAMGASLQSNTTLEKLLNVAASNHDHVILAKLKPADLECGSRVAECMEGTRQDIFSQINDWLVDLDSPNILWIKGYPGIGKSAIASSLVEQLRISKRLGSNFFFQRERAAVMTSSALWRTVACDLARQYSSIRKHVVAVLETDEAVSTTNIGKLFLQLIHKPLMVTGEIPLDRLPVIVIDALDESGGLDGSQSEDRKNVVRTLKQWSSLPGRFKLVVTSREENDIARLFSTTNHQLIELWAGQQVNSQSSGDIKTFLEVQFREIATQYPRSLPPDWPGSETIMDLTKKAAGLFIWAKTVIRFVTLGDPDEQLRKILEGSGVGGLSSLYSWILDTAFPSPSEEFIQNFRLVLGGVILAKSPLATSPVEHLLSIRGPTLEYICNGLQSVMDSQDVLRINHQSFVDFLIDQNQAPQKFRIERKRESRSLTLACLHTMRRNLRFNICSLKSSYLRNAEVPELESQIKGSIPPYLSYSSCFWASHLAETACDMEVFELLQCFMQNQFLFWLEVLSIIKQVNQASTMLRILANCIRTYGEDDTMVTEMQKFVSAFASVISQSAPHIYLSALPFTPRKSAVSKRYLESHTHTLVIRNGGQNDWPAMQNVLSGHKGGVNSVSLSPDGTRLVSGSSDTTIRVWDTETGEVVVGPLEGHTERINSVAFSPDGKRILSGSSDTTIRVWDVETGEVVIGPLEGHTGAIYSVTFSPDGRRIISGSEDMTIRVWDAETGEVVVGPLEGHNGWIRSVAVSADGRRIISGAYDGTIRIWDAEVGEVIIGPLERHTERINSVAFSPDGKRIISGSSYATIRVWDADTGEVVIGPLEGHTGAIYSVTFSPDGRRIISGSEDMTIRVWDAETGEAVLGPLEGHTNRIRSVAVSPDGRRIISGATDAKIRVWDAEAGEVVVEPLEGHTDWIRSVAVCPDGRCIISGGDDTTIRVWDAETGEVVVGPLEGHAGGINSVAFSSDGRRIISGADDREVRVWDAETGGVVVEPLGGHTGVIYSVTFSPDGRRIISGADDRMIRVWDAETGEVVVGPLKGHTNWIRSLAVSPDGRRIISGSDDTTIRVWDAETGEVVVGPLKGHTERVKSVAFSPDGRRIISGGNDRTIRLWDAETGEVVIGPLEGHTGVIYSVTFSPDGRRIISGSEDMMIRVWDAETGVVLGSLEGHTERINSVAFSPDGRRIISGSGDKTIRVWDVETMDFPKQNQIEPYFSDSSKMQDGWIVGPNSELLFWVPPSIRPGLLRPSNVVVIGKLVMTRLDLKNFVHGESWTLSTNRRPGD